MTIEELKKYKWFVATCKYEGIVGKKHCFTYSSAENGKLLQMGDKQRRL